MTDETTQLVPQQPDQPACAVGWFGKLPAAGDFLCRRLPDEFREPWDRWLSAGMLGAKAALGDRWDERFLSFPVWRFLWNTAQSSQPVWTGVLLPGVDRVGRLFPLTIAMPLARDRLARVDPGTLDARLDDFQRLALRVLEDDDIDGFDRDLQALPSIEPESSIDMATDAVSDFSAWIKARGLAQLAAGPALTLFWLPRGAERGVMRVEDNPPPGMSFLPLIDCVIEPENQTA